MSSSLSYRVGDKVVYPNHGVGVIENISSRGAQDALQEFYLLQIEGSNLRVMVPLANAASVGLRPVSAAAEVSAMLQFLAAAEADPAPAAPPLDGAAAHGNNDWKLRFKQNSDKLRGGSLLEVAEVLKSLLQLQKNKPLSFREKKMLDHATGLLAGEVATVCALSFEDGLQQLQQALASAALVLPPPEPEENGN